MGSLNFLFPAWKSMALISKICHTSKFFSGISPYPIKDYSHFWVLPEAGNKTGRAYWVSIHYSLVCLIAPFLDFSFNFLHAFSICDNFDVRFTHLSLPFKRSTIWELGTVSSGVFFVWRFMGFAVGKFIRRRSEVFDDVLFIHPGPFPNFLFVFLLLEFLESNLSVANNEQNNDYADGEGAVRKNETELLFVGEVWEFSLRGFDFVHVG